MDFARLLGLVQLDVDRVKALCAFDEGDDVVGDVRIGLVEGNIVGVVGGGADGVGADGAGDETSVGGANDGV